MRTPVVAQIGPLNPVTYSAAPYDTLCSNAAPVTLSGGNPSGGTYTGPGVSGGVFDPSVAGVGNWTITYSFTDVNNCTGTATQIIHVDVCSGVNSLEVQSGLSVYPNPSNGDLTLELGLVKDDHSRMEVLNSLGQIIRTEEHDLVKGNNKLDLDLSSLAKGVYFIRVKTSTDVVTRRVVLE
jgi:hypothetical protein